ncbi:MAG TPA: F0F1 ATP synthase subunit B [Acidimicrobiales bacterium]|nr:F0F1 ATP synthase subunit B [Acidimicrobiales bacterium]
MFTATSNFLIPNATFFVELLAFLVVLAVIGKFVLPFLNKALKERADRIHTELDAATEAKADAAAADEARRSELETARQQAREIVAQANRTAEQVTGEGQARGQAEYERLVTSAGAEVQLARQRAVEEAAARLGDLVLEVVERIIGREVDARAHRDLIDEAVAALAVDAESNGAAATGIGQRS